MLDSLGKIFFDFDNLSNRGSLEKSFPFLKERFFFFFFFNCS